MAIACVSVPADTGNDSGPLGHLRAVLYYDHSVWIAEALEVDYLAQGSSIEDVRARFERGLGLTIAENVKNGTSRQWLHPNEADAWRQLFASNVRQLGWVPVDGLPEIGAHDFPFGAIDYYGGPFAAACWAETWPPSRPYYAVGNEPRISMRVVASDADSVHPPDPGAGVPPDPGTTNPPDPGSVHPPDPGSVHPPDPGPMPPFPPPSPDAA